MSQKLNPFSILGALSIIGIFQTAMTLHVSIETMVGAWKSITNPIVEYLFGWIFDIFGINFPYWIKSYLTLALVFGGAFVPSSIRHYLIHGVNLLSSILKGILDGVIIGLIWPWYLFNMLGMAHFEGDRNASDEVAIFKNSIFWALLLIAVSYSLRFIF